MSEISVILLKKQERTPPLSTQFVSIFEHIIILFKISSSAQSVFEFPTK